MKKAKAKPVPDPTRGDRLRDALAAAGMSQGELARRLGMRAPTISQVIRGDRVPTLDWLHRAAIAAGIDPADLAPGVLASNRAIPK